VLALVADASASTRLPCLTYVNVPLSTYCQIRYVSNFTAASSGSPWDSTAFLYEWKTGSQEVAKIFVRGNFSYVALRRPHCRLTPPPEEPPANIVPLLSVELQLLENDRSKK